MSLATTNQRLSQRLPDNGTYGAYLDALLSEMKRRPSLLYLARYLRHYGRDRDLLPYTARDATPPDLKAIHARGCDWTWHQRQWDYREHAREIIEGAAPWPRRLLPWKVFTELRYYHGQLEQMPAWLDDENRRATSRRPKIPTPAANARALMRNIQRRRGRG